MNRRPIQNRLLLPAALLLLAASAPSAVLEEDYQARTIFGLHPSGLCDPLATYQVGGVNWMTTLPSPVELQLGGTASFLQVLQTAYPSWTFVSAAQDLTANSLRIHTCDALGSSTLVGAEFDVEYVPTGGSLDPTQNVHWIQAVWDNHAIGSAHGSLEAVIDKVNKLDGVPYYDSGGAADSRNLYDYPRRSDGNQAHDWYANLYLVTGPNSAGQVTIYDGIGWGWNDVPEPGVVWLLVAAAVLAVGWRRRELLK